MLLFIQLPDSMRFIKDWFQYISCYCLSCFVSWSVNGEPISIHLMLLFIGYGVVDHRADNHFNTSHVTVYPLRKCNWQGIPIFQYISCYCLSSCSSPSGSLLLSFQYISCYCLSKRHATPGKPCYISIHLMLLFIGYDDCAIYCGVEFQYISCYCLSLQGKVPAWMYFDFNTSHVTVYRWIKSIRTFRIGISIHLMLLFIPLCRDMTVDISHFNTSHVTVYQQKATNKQQ